MGYLGARDPKEVILKGLKTLEYRGYDSSGVSILNKGKFKRVRAQGKLSQLCEKLQNEDFDGHLGIGHTRWATHGKPSERNAHPHQLNHVNIVHNGIIENYAEIKEKLIKNGSQFESETDSELVAHLIEREMNFNASLLNATINIIPGLRGAYSVLAVSEKTPDQCVAFKNGPPLLIGLGEDEIIVASDIQAIISYTKKIIYLEDDEIALISPGKVEIYNFKGQRIEKSPVTVNWDASQIEKQGYPHYMLKEIFEQPRAVAQAIDPHIDLSTRKINLSGVGFNVDNFEGPEALDLKNDLLNTNEILQTIERVFIVACGTSYYAGMLGEYLIERAAEVPVEIDLASEFRYRYPVIPKNSLLIVVSQSGETADTLAALRQAKKQGALTLSICNVPRSSIDREAHGHLYMNAGVEIGVASTKAFVSSLALMNILSLSLAKAKGLLNEDLEKKCVDEIVAAPSLMEGVLAYDKFFAQAADDLKKKRGFLYLGRGVSYPIALEGALKLKELAYMHAEGYASGEMKHGPLALIDETMAIIVLCPKDELYEKTISNLEEAKARGGMIISIGTGDDERLKSISDHYLSLPETAWYVNPLLEVIPLQLLAYYVAKSLGNDVDQPRNLAKSVTVE